MRWRRLTTGTTDFEAVFIFDITFDFPHTATSFRSAQKTPFRFCCSFKHASSTLSTRPPDD